MLRFGSPEDNEKKEKKSIGSLRRPQIITTFGCGSIVDLPNYSVIMAAADYWKPDSPVLHEHNLAKLLSTDKIKIKDFRQPFVKISDDNKPSADIPAFRFPYMHFCPQCGKLMPFWGFGLGNNSDRKCLDCNSYIVPSRFVTACVNGHLEDFPYNWWVHRGKVKECPGYGRKDNLKIKFLNTSGGLESINIICSSCGKNRTMEGSLGKDSLRGYHCWGKRPWIGPKEECNDPKECDAQMWALQRGASNLYFSITESALTIPPWSNKIQSVIDEAYDRLYRSWNVNLDETKKIFLIEHEFDDLINNGYSYNQIESHINKRFNNDFEEKYQRKDIYFDEYQAFCGECKDDYQFKTTRKGIPESLKPYISDIVLVNRLREIMALKGFRRITPDVPSTNNDKFKGYDFESERDCISLFKDDQEWLPAIELLGEGIFIKLNENKINEWAVHYKPRYEILCKRKSKSNILCENFSANYILLHTLSHLLIRQLSLECGYSASAIKERIYGTYPDDDNKMNGILLFTSSSDSDGSLGGLVRQGLPESFEFIFKSMLENAKWCSSDPVCIESESQGLDSLNMSACHACSLLPETSCERRNCFLDRAAITGKLHERHIGFFNELL